VGLHVICECDRALPVAERDAGGSVNCPCGRRVVVALIALLWHRRRAARRRQRRLKGLLGNVPVFRQLLEKYPHAAVVLPG
jgi:hypothetical protein